MGRRIGRRKGSQDEASRDQNGALKEPKEDQKGAKLKSKSLLGLSWGSPGHPGGEGRCPKACPRRFGGHFRHRSGPFGNLQKPLGSYGGSKERCVGANRCARSTFFDALRVKCPKQRFGWILGRFFVGLGISGPS